MADEEVDSPSGEDVQEDPQLKIRIPNPKTFMARQAQWVSRRGKLRCDTCRTNNLKCDRAHPACNHCSWTPGKECTYTPLPTPAHRGIPRCDPCRLKNYKCDRNLPVCNNCEGQTDLRCNYTPKRRHKVSDGHQFVEGSDGPFIPVHIPGMKQPQSSISISSIVPMPSISTPGPSDGQHRWNVNAPADLPAYPASLSAVRPAQRMPSSSRSYYRSGIIEAWTQPSFIPLPDIALERLRQISISEMPTKIVFEDGLETFLSHLMPELRECATFPAARYVGLARCLSSSQDKMHLPPALRIWMSCHPLRIGSNKLNLILIPKDHIYTHESEMPLLEAYRNFVDSKMYTVKYRNSLENQEMDSTGWRNAFDRIPVQEQIFDILVYAHRDHLDVFQMLKEIRELGFTMITWVMAEIFVRLCPLCNMRQKNIMGVHKPAKTSPSTSGNTPMEGVVKT